ncbi:MAG: efflux transporter outer membrane subunit [Sedimentisphaerales bacterium]|nr:efflux transporter outer membrane subunit [Sedimentisphaerales bacterium]
MFLYLAGISGCTVGPDFVPLTPDVPAGWSSSRQAAPVDAGATSAEDLKCWWTLFNDPVLTGLVEEAFRSNLDLQIAAARIRQARASRAMAASGLGPTVDVSGSYRRSQTGGSQNPTVNQYQAGFDAGWEIDIFGGVRREWEAADAELQSAVENQRDVRITLAAEVARNYIELRTYQQRIAIAEKNLEAQKHSAKLTVQRFDGGLVSGLDVANADAQVATTAAQIPLLESSARQTIHALSVLLDRPIEPLVQELSPASEIPLAPPAVPVGIPSDLLRRRPDIRGAEADIHAATARIGVATADLFPQFSIGGSLGWQASRADPWFTSMSRFWSLGPSVSWRVFETGRTLSNIELQKALEDQALLTYRQTVLTTIREVEDALTASAREQEYRQALLQAVSANRKAADLATKLYVGGDTDFLNVLSAQRSLYSSQDALVQSTGAISLDLVSLYKALGGGWQDL